MNLADQIRTHFLMAGKKRFWFRFILLVLLGGGVYLLMRNYEQQFVYAPSPVIHKTPTKAGLPFDKIALVSDDGISIQGWFVPAATPEQAPSTNAAPPTLLFFHGRTGNMSDCLEKLRLFHDLGLDVFIIDYHGYGQSDGAPSERALAGDALAAYFYLTQKRNVKPERIYLFGEDIGAAVAIDLATRVSAAGLITEGAYASIIENIENDWPLIPWQYLLRNQFDSLTKIRDVHMPVLFIHSAEDDLVPMSDSRRLYAVANEPKEFVEIHGPHRDAFVKSFDVYYDKIEQFVRGGPRHKSADAMSSTQTNAPASKGLTP